MMNWRLFSGHIARHRGFRSNSKNEAGTNTADETSKMKKAMEVTREGLAKYRSFGDMIANDPKFADRKRNRDKDYSHTAKRSDLEDEVRAIFRAQLRLGSATATELFLQSFTDAAFFQRPLQNSEDKVGECPFRVRPEASRSARTVLRAFPLSFAAGAFAPQCWSRRASANDRRNCRRIEEFRRAEKHHLQDFAQGSRS